MMNINFTMWYGNFQIWNTNFIMSCINLSMFYIYHDMNCRK
jgi:hypothetical protein